MTASPETRTAADRALAATAAARDLELLERAAGGDERALGDLYDHHGETVFSLAKAIVKAQADAEDVSAAVFAQLWRTAAQYDATRGTVAAWLCTITRTRALDLLRARKRRERAEEAASHADEQGLALPLAQPPRSPDADVELGEARQVVARSLAALPEPQRRVIELAYFGGLSQSDIAERLQEPLGTVKTRMRSALEKLRQSLGPFVREGRI
jgi:RNA polymerase sigma-70 factor, ECF subfamily